MSYARRPPGNALAVTIAGTGTSFRVARLVRMADIIAPPPSLATPVEGGAHSRGFVYELTDANGRVIYQVPGRDPYEPRVEFHGRRSLASYDLSPAEARTLLTQEIEVLVPESLLSSAARLRVYSEGAARTVGLAAGSPIVDAVVQAGPGSMSIGGVQL